jgi:hypothetical protein
VGLFLVWQLQVSILHTFFGRNNNNSIAVRLNQFKTECSSAWLEHRFWAAGVGRSNRLILNILAHLADKFINFIGLFMIKNKCKLLLEDMKEIQEIFIRKGLPDIENEEEKQLFIDLRGKAADTYHFASNTLSKHRGQ